MIVPSSNGTMSARMRIVEEHVTRENEHNLDGIVDTFGEKARYDDEGWGAHYQGRQEVREFYAQMLQAMPDLNIDIRRRHASEDAIIVEVEVVIRGRHLGTWRGLHATGRQMEFPLCGIFTFDEGNRVAGEKIYYDRATPLGQLGGVSRSRKLAWANHHRTYASGHHGAHRRAKSFEALNLTAPTLTTAPSQTHAGKCCDTTVWHTQPSAHSGADVIGCRRQRARASRRVGKPSSEQDMIQPGPGSRSPVQKRTLPVQRSIRRTVGRSRIQQFVSADAAAINALATTIATSCWLMASTRRNVGDGHCDVLLRSYRRSILESWGRRPGAPD
jgi:steroid delta-isomerase-like uncharacterized protein